MQHAEQTRRGAIIIHVEGGHEQQSETLTVVLGMGYEGKEVSWIASASKRKAVKCRCRCSASKFRTYYYSLVCRSPLLLKLFF